MDIGTICIKIAGRDAGKTCVIVDNNDKRVLIDGETRRRTVNATHLEPTGKTIEIGQGASREDVKNAFKTLGIELTDRKPKQKTERPKKQHKVKKK